MDFTWIIEGSVVVGCVPGTLGFSGFSPARLVGKWPGQKGEFYVTNDMELLLFCIFLTAIRPGWLVPSVFSGCEIRLIGEMYGSRARQGKRSWWAIFNSGGFRRWLVDGWNGCLGIYGCLWCG